MPRYHGTLSVEHDEQDDSPKLGHLMLPPGRRWPTPEEIATTANIQNLSTDPVTIALTRAMALDYLAILDIMRDEDYFHLAFNGGGQGDDAPHHVSLPETHQTVRPLPGMDSTISTLMTSGERGLSLAVDGGVWWQVYAHENADGPKTGCLYVTFVAPSAQLAALENRARSGELRLSHVIAIPGIEIDPAVTSVRQERDKLTILVDITGREFEAA